MADNKNPLPKEVLNTILKSKDVLDTLNKSIETLVAYYGNSDSEYKEFHNWFLENNSDQFREEKGDGHFFDSESRPVPYSQITLPGIEQQDNETLTRALVGQKLAIKAKDILTANQMEIYELTLDGYDADAIAIKNNVKVRTIKNRIEAIKNKLRPLANELMKMHQH